MDSSEAFFNLFNQVFVDINKLYMEELGYDLSTSANTVEYHNYLQNNPIQFTSPEYNSFGDPNSPFSGAGAGKLPVPSGFYPDSVLYKFISTAEGSIGVQWVSEYKGHNIVRSAACFGYDFPGGVHDPSYINKLGLTQQDGDSLGITNSGRRPMGGEWYGGKVQWGWYTNSIPAGHPYWQKLIPYYRDEMIWAWHQPIIQNVKDPAERLARMHSINWWGHHYLRGFHGGPGFPHRLKAAQQACAGMQRFA